jgi:hypothetical protein
MKTSSTIRLLLLLIIISFTSIYSQPVTISGFVTDSTNGYSLIGANIFLKDLPLGSSTNDEGYFAIYPVNPGQYTLICSFLGYETFKTEITVKPTENIFLNISIAPQPLEAKALNVTAEAEAMERDINISEIQLSTRTIRQVPQLGEVDLFRTLQALPGIVSESDFSTGLVVRGGNADQNLIMLDGITVYNPSHLGGLFSNFLMDAVKDAHFIKGGFGAEYGGRMSSVLNVISKEGNRKEFSGGAGVSLLSSRLSLEAPVKNGALLLAGRRTYVDQAAKLIGEEFPYYFYDFQGSFHQDLTPYDRLTVSGYFGEDILDWDEYEFNFKWGNRTLSAHWQHVFSPRLFSHFMIAGSRFRTKVELGGSQGVNSRNVILDYTLKGDMSYFSSQQNNYKFGFEIKKLKFTYNSSYDNRELLSIKQEPTESAFYVQNNRQLSNRFLIIPGVRLNYFSDQADNIYIGPRLAMKYQLRHGEYLNFSTGLYRQFMFTVRDEFSPSVINEWFAIDNTVPAGKSIHYILGYERELWSTTNLQIEAYYKTLDNMLTYRETRSAVDESLGSDIEVDKLFVPTQGHSFGLEFFLHKKYGRLTGWMGYTLNWARSKLDNFEYYASFDRRHDLKILFSYDLGRKWAFGNRFNYGSGFPYTRAIATYLEKDNGADMRRIIYSKRNAFRYPAYMRWDISFTKKFKWFKQNWTADLQIVNVLNRENIFFYNWDFNENPAKRDEITMLPLVPTIGIGVEF